MNLNDQVEVTLTAYGAARLSELPLHKRHKAGEVYRDHLWSLMYDLGPRMYNGGPQCFVNNEIRLVGE